LALPISAALKVQLADTVKTPVLIVEIEGLPPFSSSQAQKYINFGDNIVFGQSGLYYGGLINDDTVLPYIDLSIGTNNITQQLIIDKGGYSSTSQFDVAIVDKNQLVTELITPGKVVDDILSKKAKLYLSFEGAGHPQDSILFFNGIVSDVSANAGLIKLSISAPEKLKSQDLFTKISTETTAAITNVQTTIPVNSVNGFIMPADSGTLRTYIMIEDEIIEVSGTSGNSFTSCVRAQFGTIAVAHDLGANVETFYRLQGNLRDLSLKLMLSGPDEFYITDMNVISYNQYGNIVVANAVFLPRYNLVQNEGVVLGDTVVITDSINNNGTYIITQIQETALGSYLILNGTMISEVAGSKISFKSKYNVLPSGAGLEMSPDQVDIAQFETLYARYQASFFNYDFYIKEEIKGTEFINEKILFPNGCYSLPRKAKISMGVTSPPLATANTKKLDNANVLSASKINIKRSISKHFYNAVVYKYDIDAVEDKFLRGRVTQSADSTNRIKISNKSLVIEGDGIRPQTGFDFIFNTQTRRQLERYQFAAEYLDIEVLFGDGFEREIGDTVILDGRNLEISDSVNGTRVFQPRIFEIQNKSYSLMGKAIKFSLVDTIYSLNGRYGVNLPSSKVGVGSNSSEIKLQRSYGTLLTFNSETTKWIPYIGEKVLFRNNDWTIQEIVIFQGINPADDNSVIVDPPLSFVPDSTIIMDIPNYTSDPLDLALYKAVGTFYTKSVPVLTGIDNFSFTVDNQYLGYMQVGAPIIIFNDDHSIQSIETVIESVSGNTITTKKDLGIVPSLGTRCELQNFLDGGKSYRYI
jgi:hypothetical protein